MRLGVVCALGTANAYYRAQLPMQALERRGNHVAWPTSGDPMADLGRYANCEAVVMHRAISPSHLELIDELQRRDVTVICDNDDDLHRLPKVTRKWNGRSRRETRRDADLSIEIARRANLVTTPSPYLAERFHAYGVREVAVIENMLAKHDIGRERGRHAGLVIGCTAALEHGEDIDKLRIPQALRATLEDHDGVRVVAIGMDLKLKGPRYQLRREVPVTELIACEREFDIGIAPLVDTPFNRSRSNVKLKEYAAAGATWLASPVGPYAGMGTEQGGELVADSDWREALSTVITDYRVRLERTKQARAWASRQSIEDGATAWLSALRTATRLARQTSST